MDRTASDVKSVITSIGHAMSSPTWVDAHYLACQREYEEMIRSVGLQPGWHVLDAGCGTGQFIPIIAGLVGKHGRVSAVDVAPENAFIAQSKAASNGILCPIDVRVSDIRALPFGDETFDAVWNANVAQYMNERELDAALGEFRRVLKPGGVLAIKDGDITALQIFPIPATLLWRLLDAWARRGDQQIQGLLQSLALPDCLRRTGFSSVTRRVTFMERTAPFSPPEAQFVAQLTEFFAALACALDLSTADIKYWREITDRRSPKSLLKQSNLYLREAAVLVSGIK